MMHKQTPLILQLFLVVVLLAYASIGFGQERVEGVVVSTKLTKCNFKPGGCEGNLVLETPRGDTKEQLTIKVPLGTQIKKGTEDIFLPALRGNLVAVTHVSENGEKVAKSIELIKKP
jgi:hypothetical protein